MMNSSHTPNLLQQWAILPEWAIGSFIGIVTAIAGMLAFAWLKDHRGILMTKNRGFARRRQN
ncbi:hypothetical protein [Bosea sp. CS1GBMeth4]|uniref:hypothetical protein n=1 Tax=Bosea sp. CS1GBMeth4 TaxID=1892849 RepID=UPI001647EC06|nr:hypothetical protein [Bosea sp. CS1GBMeth4]